MTKKEFEAVRLVRVRQLSEARPAEDRTETGVLPFYAWLQKRYPELLPTGPSDAYQHLRADLKGLYK